MTPQRYDDRSIEALRARVVDVLAEAYARGALEMEEYERRVAAATNTVSTTQLEALVVGLPVPAARKPQVSSPRSYSGAVSDPAEVRSSQTIVNVFSGSSKGGAWTPARSVTMVNVFGGGDLDLREARLSEQGVTINVICVFGGTDIYVPEDVNVETNGFGLFGGFDSKAPEGRRLDAPTIRINGFCLFGGVDVKTRRR